MEKVLPQTYEEKKIHLRDNPKKFGWDKETFLAFLNDDQTRIFAILGGDVFEFDEGTGNYKNTYDNWYINRNGPAEAFGQYVERSRQAAIEFLGTLTREDLVFSPVISSEVTAGL